MFFALDWLHERIRGPLSPTPPIKNIGHKKRKKSALLGISFSSSFFLLLAFFSCRIYYFFSSSFFSLKFLVSAIPLLYSFQSDASYFILLRRRRHKPKKARILSLYIYTCTRRDAMHGCQFVYFIFIFVLCGTITNRGVGRRFSFLSSHPRFLTCNAISSIFVYLD